MNLLVNWLVHLIGSLIRVTGFRKHQVKFCKEFYKVYEKQSVIYGYLFVNFIRFWVPED